MTERDAIERLIYMRDEECCEADREALDMGVKALEEKMQVVCIIDNISEEDMAKIGESMNRLMKGFRGDD